jgi:hypothetical protein
LRMGRKRRSFENEGRTSSNKAKCSETRAKKGVEEDNADKEEEEEVVVDKDGRIAFEGSLDFGFQSYSRALGVASPKKGELMLTDCCAAFIEGGCSFWVGAGESARTGLEVYMLHRAMYACSM